MNLSLQETINKINTWDNFNEFTKIFLPDDNKMSAREAIECAIKDLLDYLEITEANYSQFLNSNSDFWNDTNENGNFFADLVHEWADSQVDIYYSDIFKNAWNFYGFEEEYIWQFGAEDAGYAVKNGGVSRLLQQIQYTAYDQFANTVLQSLNTVLQSLSEE